MSEVSGDLLGKRNSSIEALKIVAIILIVISHVVQTLGIKGNAYISYSDYAVNIQMATKDIQLLIISMLRYCGTIGNTIFFICSAWFFLDNNRINRKKILVMIADVWIISVIILSIVFFIERKIKGSLVIASFFPILFENNWYINCYLMFYLLHPILNKVIAALDQRTLFRMTAIMSLMYFVLAFGNRLTALLFNMGTVFFESTIIIWMVIYFLLAYMRKYTRFMDDINVNKFLVSIGLLGSILMVILSNMLGLKNSIFSESLLIWNEANNPFIVCFAIGSFNIARSKSFENKVINYISKLSLCIYLFHENRILRNIYRPAMWQYVYTNFGYNNILIWVLVLTLVTALFGLISSFVYYESIHKIVTKYSRRLYLSLISMLTKMEKHLMK